MVCLHTATMGVHPACFFTDRVEKDATLAWNRAGKQSSYLVHSSLYCAPTGERQETFASLSYPANPQVLHNRHIGRLGCLARLPQYRAGNRLKIRVPSIFQSLFGWFRSHVFTGRMISVGTPSAS